jgi:hypothetical protein
VFCPDHLALIDLSVAKETQLVSMHDSLRVCGLEEDKEIVIINSVRVQRRQVE